MGLILRDGGANIAVRSEGATAIEICLFDEGDKEIQRSLLSQQHGSIHFDFFEGVKEGQRYGLRAHGKYDPASGQHFDPAKLLLDPYAKSLTKAFTYHPDLSRQGTDTAALVPKAIAAPPFPVVPFRQPHQPKLIYELNVRSFSMRHPDIPAEKRGTIAAIAEPVVLEHLESIGVDTVELMPIAAWIDERHLANLGLRNAWGYNPVSFFAIDPRLAPGGLKDLRDTVATLHEKDINVLLDVVFNHTGESDALGPNLSFRGLDNAGYYRLFHGGYVNDAGTGNTLALDRPHTVDLVVAALRHWVEACGIDGFRFDLATILGRTESGFAPKAPLLEAINADPLLSSRILIAEPWDLGPGGYQLGNFPANWLEWNDRYRDDVRRFWRGDAFSANALATRLAGSSDVFHSKGRPSRSVNFIAAHDGFTLRDLLHFRTKQNLANGENNRDGKADEVTCVGSSAAALLATLIFSRGTAMITAGDEFGRTQGGNNNAYAQDNETTWLDWRTADRALIQTFAQAIQTRNSLNAFFEDAFLNVDEASWHGPDGKPVTWTDPQLRTLTLVLTRTSSRLALHLTASNTWQPMAVQPRAKFSWREVFSSRTDGHPHGVAVYEEIEN